MIRVGVGAERICVTHCAGVDEDGDLFSFRAMAFGAGKYEMGPGTGKYAHGMGGGTFEPLPTVDPASTPVRCRALDDFERTPTALSKAVRDAGARVQRLSQQTHVAARWRDLRRPAAGARPVPSRARMRLFCPGGAKRPHDQSE